jgi:hypothetical protein
MNNLTLMLQVLCEMQGSDVPSILEVAQGQTSISPSSGKSSDMPVRRCDE